MKVVWRPVVGAMAIIVAAVTSSGAARVEALAYSSVDRPGPALSVPCGVLAQSLSCTADVAGAGRAPVLLVPGTWVSPREHYGWNYLRALDALGWPYCTVTTPKHAMEDLQISAEYVVYAIRSMFQRAGRPIAVLGGSQAAVCPGGHCGSGLTPAGWSPNTSRSPPEPRR